MTSTNIGTYTWDVTSNPSPLHSLLGQIGPDRAKHGCMVWTALNQHPGQPPPSCVCDTKRGCGSLWVEPQHWQKGSCSADILWFWTWHCSDPAVVGYPHQTHLLHLEWKFHGYLRKQRALRFHCFPLSSWLLLWLYIKWKEENSDTKMWKEAAV